MNVKLIGSCLLLAAGVWSSVLLARYEKRRVSVLDGYMALIRLIRGEIGASAKPLDRILGEADPATLASCAGGGRVPVCRDLASLVAASRAYLGPEAERLLCGFASTVGAGFRADELRRCDECLASLSDVRGRLFDGLPARLRTGCTLCVTLTLSAALLLW